VSYFDELAGLPPIQIWDGLVARAVESERVTLSVIELDANTAVPEHAHENEQVGVLISGSVRFTIGGETRDVGPGSTWSIPAHVPHDVVVGPEDAIIVEVFAPRRDDWASKERLPASSPRWP
jgi:quercetin dioxygenase-like cupin family protein